MTFDDARILARYVRRLPAFLRVSLTPEECHRAIESGLQMRERNLAVVIERAVFANPGSPYAALFSNAGIELGDALELIRDEGVEDALTRFYDAGVFVTLDEFKGRRSIERSGLSLDVSSDDFDNPLIEAAFPSRTGGSRGVGRRVMVDLEHTRHKAVYHSLFLDTFAARDRPHALWRAVPPGLAGIGAAIGYAKIGRPLDRWFSPNRLAPHRRYLREFLFSVYAISTSRRAGVPIPWPEYVPFPEAKHVARWLEEAKRDDRPALLSTTASAAVRVCLAAQQSGIGIEGTLFRAGGEPLTEAKARVVESSGCRIVANYTMTEAGRIGLACANPTAVDDLHLVSDKLALIQRERTVRTGGSPLPAFFLTTLTGSSPKLMLNVESDDYGVVEDRSCGCPLGELGLSRHLHSIRSYEKLTSEGMSFLGSELIALVEEVLPTRFGGSPIDYQLVEEEVDGLPKVGIIVSPGVGPVDERKLIATALEMLSAGPSYRGMMAEIWQTGETLRVLRREPYATASAKILPLHLIERG
jgi:hypothetical protein